MRTDKTLTNEEMNNMKAKAKKKEKAVSAIDCLDLEAGEIGLSRLSVNDLSMTTPVSPAEEKRLINQVIQGKRAARQLLSEPPPDPAEVTRLKKLVDTGAQARRVLIQTNGRLVISIAAKYIGFGISLAELCQEGVLGLIRAVDKFDTSKGERLSTYATY